MRTNILRSVAVALGICTCGVAQAQYGGYAPQPAYRNAPSPGYAASAAPVHPSLQPPARPGLQTGQTGLQPRGAYQPAPAAGSPYRMVSDQVGSALPSPDGSRPSANARPLAPPPAPAESQLGGGKAPGLSAKHDHSAHAHSAGHGRSIVEGDAAIDGSCGDHGVGSLYNRAAAAPWIGAGPQFGHGSTPLGDAPGPMRNWFGGGNLLFFDFEEDSNQRLVIDDAMPTTTLLETSEVTPGGDTGFEVFLGRYFGCGKYALSASYFLFNPDQDELIVRPGMPGDFGVAMPNWTRMYIDRDGDGTPDDVGDAGDMTDDTIYGMFDEAAAYRIRRDVDIQGVELNFITFGIGGAMRAGLAGDCGSCGVSGCGGMCRPMLPACNDRFQLQVSHGLRWLQFKDAFEFAASEAANGYGAGDDDFYYNVETENDLIGYQFGARADYCIARRVNLYAGGKFGIYGNRVDYDSRIGTRGTAAQVTDYYPSMQDMSVEVCDRDTVLSTLGELDLGLGFRLTDCWSLTGGYRMIGATNVATSVGSLSDDPAHIGQGHAADADDSLLIHGGYFGAQYNW